MHRNTHSLTEWVFFYFKINSFPAKNIDEHYNINEYILYASFTCRKEYYVTVQKSYEKYAHPTLLFSR